VQRQISPDASFHWQRPPSRFQTSRRTRAGIWSRFDGRSFFCRTHRSGRAYLGATSSGREAYPTRNTVHDRAPCAPITSACSMSAVFDGPEMNRPNVSPSNDTRS
jgi:hypothetical protein